MTSDSLNWGLEANGFYGNSVNAVSTPQRHYFTLPTFARAAGVQVRNSAWRLTCPGTPVLKQFPTLSVRDTRRREPTTAWCSPRTAGIRS